MTTNLSTPDKIKRIKVQAVKCPKCKAAVMANKRSPHGQKRLD